MLKRLPNPSLQHMMTFDKCILFQATGNQKKKKIFISNNQSNCLDGQLLCFSQLQTAKVQTDIHHCIFLDLEDSKLATMCTKFCTHFSVGAPVGFLQQLILATTHNTGRRMTTHIPPPMPIFCCRGEFYIKKIFSHMNV